MKFSLFTLLWSVQLGLSFSGLPLEQARQVWMGAVNSSFAAIRFSLNGLHEQDNIHVYSAPWATLDETKWIEWPSVSVKHYGLAYSFVSGENGKHSPDTMYTVYTWIIRVNQDRQKMRVSGFRTFPKEGIPASFSFGAASCAKFHEHAAKTFAALNDLDPHFFIVSGDLFYADVKHNNFTTYQESYASVFKHKAQSLFFASRPVYYIFDDHDFGENNANMKFSSRKAALNAFQTFYAHPVLPIAQDGQPIGFQAFSVGRCRFILTYLRSQATGDIGEHSSTLGLVQRDLFFRELQEYQRYQIVFWVNSKVWTSNSSRKENWGVYHEERRIIANRISELGVNNLVVIGGDAHMSGISDGAHTDYSTRGDHGSGFILVHAGPIYNRGNYKGSVYNRGHHVLINPKRFSNQFGLFQVQDDGVLGGVCLVMTTYDVTQHSGWDYEKSVKLRYSHCFENGFNSSVRNTRNTQQE